MWMGFLVGGASLKPEFVQIVNAKKWCYGLISVVVFIRLGCFVDSKNVYHHSWIRGFDKHVMVYFASQTVH